MTLEQQIATLAEFGLHLNEDITIDDLLCYQSRETYEKSPFNHILFCYGNAVQREPWDQLVCSKVWNFDLECIEDPGDYVNIVQSLCRISEQGERFTDIEDSIDYEDNTAWLEYTIDGQKRHLIPEIDDDWADMEIINKIMDDIGGDDQRFYAIDAGQGMLLFYLDTETGTKLNHLTNDALQAMN